MPRQGNVRIEARFNKPIPEPVTWILYGEFPGHVEIDNTINFTGEYIPLRRIKFYINMKVFCEVYLINILTSTLIKSSIIAITFDKYYMPGSHFVWCIGMLIILIRMVSHPTSSKSWHSCNATQYLGHSTSTEYRE